MDSMRMPADTRDASAKRPRRRRTAVACNTCRSRKIKCNGTYPSCFLCLESGLTCEYRTTEVERESVSELKRRLEAMEGMIQSMQSVQTMPWEGAGWSQPSNLALWSLSDVAMEDLDLSPMVPQEDFVHGDDLYYGPSTTSTFLRKVLQSVDSRSLVLANGPSLKSCMESIDLDHLPPATLFSCRNQMSSTTSVSNEDFYILPSLPTTQLLVENFFRGYGPINPFLNHAAFLQTHVDSIYQSRQQPNTPRLALLNMVLAMSLTTEIDLTYAVERRILLARKFYQRARGLCTRNVLQPSNLDLVHTYILMSQYLQSTDDCAQSWLTHGLAVQAAIQIGLHVHAADEKNHTVDEECRRRTWHTCVIMDRTLGQQFGRPCFIPRQMDVALPIDMDYESSLSPMSYVGDLGAASPSFFIQAIKLYHVLWEILESVYRQNCPSNDSFHIFDLMGRVAECEKGLDNWAADLPPPFTINGEQEARKGVHRGGLDSKYLVTMLQIRYHGTRHLLHRPILERFLTCLLSSPASADSSRQLDHLLRSCQHSLHICAASSATILELANVLAEGAVPAMWWATTYYVVNAAVTCFALICLQAIDHDSQKLNHFESTVELKKHIRLGISALPKLCPGHPAISRAMAFLQNILSFGEAICESLYAPLLRQKPNES
ncbi:fungal-specific transcription factor domain-containing protein [Ilyonectria sp. MPI-CAGE-AT-0026]|nr:fungal-specific transcription factor domain-containing protein [Ilyonectria sp. MPI-CAGE-AT-0026]